MQTVCPEGARVSHGSLCPVGYGLHIVSLEKDQPRGCMLWDSRGTVLFSPCSPFRFGRDNQPAHWTFGLYPRIFFLLFQRI
ncbi:serine-rich and transmembrane domain-containing protein 1 isoform X2 [Corapipo altera]|uniref:serine-rich and transmembrane domain-containing protein 1 isoform X2 n=1 Tax=Corapipo altera TaxID=415028 RepID=UPI000FD69EB9|nr:serine-rich and transmembrane domain-containing protein 1 isoform X2 [Corapipo altera]